MKIFHNLADPTVDMDITNTLVTFVHEALQEFVKGPIVVEDQISTKKLHKPR